MHGEPMDITSLALGALLGLLVGLLGGAFAGWRLARSSAPDPRAADQAFEEQMAARADDVDRLVRPVTDALTRVERQLSDTERQRAQAYGELREQVRSMGQTSDLLRTETSSLVTALRAPHVRGRWGELQLRRVVEVAGLVEHCDFTEQMTLNSDDRVSRPDLVVHLAGGKHVVVDSKVPFAAYLEAMNAVDEVAGRSRMAAHSKHLRDHIDQLASKAYWQQLAPAPEFVILFIPAEPFLSSALDHDPSLLEYAFERQVVLATPNTLVALLRTISYTWRQDALAANAQQVLTLGKELHQRLGVLGAHMTKLGNALDSTVKSFNQTVSSLETRVLVTARRFTDLRVSEDELTAPAPIDLAPRMPQASELTDVTMTVVDDTPRSVAG